MSYHDYKNKGPYTCYDQIHHFRKNFIHDLGCNGSELRAATDRALEMRFEFTEELPEVPLAQNGEWPSLQDFIRLEQWFITVRKTIFNIMNEGAFDDLEEDEGNQEATHTCEHSPDFRSVTWYGQPYTFNKTQSKIIKLLWESWEDPTKIGVDENTIAAAINTTSDKYRLINSFRSHGKKHPAWDTMIKHIGNSVHRLTKPKNETT